ncbi:peptidoglycan-binding domain-containing protein [Botrimarina sp.]|uniref:peptidoglycan-binding domain-containing protein n=1 Tax=Botrimarina sp. TaxID=2795802 RepID=UPI0032EED9F4
MPRATLAPTLLAVLCSAAAAADFDFYGRSGDAILLDFGSLPGVPAGATFSGLALDNFFGHAALSSDDLDQGDFASGGRLWVLANPDFDRPDLGDSDPTARGFQGKLTGSVRVSGETKTFSVTVQPGFTGAGPGAVEQSLERLGRAANNPLYVAQQQQRLRYLGFARRGGGPVTVNGDLGATTDEALRTFQAAVVGGVNTRQSDVDGIVGPNTAAWLNAANAPTWDELIDPDPQPYPPAFSVERMIGDFDLLPSFDSDGSGRTGRTPQIERFGTSWAIELMEAGSAAAKAATGVTQLMNGMSTRDGYGSAAYHGTHRAGMDIDLHVDYPTHNFGDGAISAAEQGVIDTAVAFVDAGAAGGPERGGVARFITSNRDILDGVRAARPGTSLYYDDSGGHRNHLHVDVAPPERLAGLANLPGDFNLDGSVDAADYTVWRDGLGATLTGDAHALWAGAYGAAAGAAAVPEPTGLAVAATLAALLVSARR